MKDRSIVRRAGLLTAIVVALCLVHGSGHAATDVDFDIRGGQYGDVDKPFFGGGVLAGLGHSWYFNPNVEYVFVDNGDYFTANADFHYDFDVQPFYWWVGGGPALARRNPDIGRDDTDAALNALTGIAAKSGQVRPFAQLKLVVKDDPEGVLAAGIRF